MDFTGKPRANHDFCSIFDRFLVPRSVQNSSKLDLGCTIMDLTRKPRANQAQRTYLGFQISSKSIPNGDSRCPVHVYKHNNFPKQNATYLHGFVTDTYRCVHIHTYSNLTTRSPQHVMIRRREQQVNSCLLYTSPSPRDRTRSRMPSSA